MPLEDPNVIDIILKPDEQGKVGLVITDAGLTTDPAQRFALFRQKVINYCTAVIEGEFKQDYPDLSTPDFYIKVISELPPTPEMLAMSVVGSKSRPEHRMEVYFERNDGNAWPTQRFKMEQDPSRIPPMSAELKALVDAQLDYAFKTIREGCFHNFAVSSGANEAATEVFLLGVPPEEHVRCAQSLAAKAARDVRHFCVVADATLGGSDGLPQDALLVRASERGRPKGVLVALRYQRHSWFKKASVVGEPQVIGECENDFEAKA
jgi:hypothetical protein